MVYYTSAGTSGFPDLVHRFVFKQMLVHSNTLSLTVAQNTVGAQNPPNPHPRLNRGLEKVQFPKWCAPFEQGDSR
jgi:hypothetical protein